MGTTIPGGYFLGKDGEPHDAFGRPVEERSDKAIAEAEGKAAELTPEETAAIAQAQEAKQKALEAKEAADKAKAAGEAATAVGEASAKAKAAKAK